MTERLPLLVLTRYFTRELSYFDDWRDAFTGFPGFDARILDLEKAGERETAHRLIPAAPFVIALHSTTGNGLERLHALLPALTARRGKLAVFIGNELNLPLSPMAEKLAFLKASATDLVLTQFLQEAGDWLYGGHGAVRVLSLPHALNPAAYRRGGPLGERAIGIGVRSHRYGLYVGDMERADLLDFIAAEAPRHGLSTDIVTDGARLDRAGWEAFLQSCRATVANEAGSFWIDRDDAMMAEIQARIRNRGSGMLVYSGRSPLFRMVYGATPAFARKLAKRLLRGRTVAESDLDRLVPPDEVRRIQADVFRPERRAPVYTKVISSRHFDAIGTRTLQILTPGRYNDMLRPGEHYLEIRPDFSNFGAVAEAVKDPTRSQLMVDAAYEHASARHSYAHRMQRLHEVLQQL